MIGVYNYTVWLTYLSLLSAGSGIIVPLTDFNGHPGHPYIGVFFLMFCGLCDAFDGRVARMKKERTDVEKNFGIQIDSLSDAVAFGVLPACIGVAMMRTSPVCDSLKNGLAAPYDKVLRFIFYAVLVLYILAAVIRLAYFNVMEELRQKTEDGCRKFYTGLPVTSSAIIFPTVMLLQYILPIDITPIYFAVAVLTGYLFLAKFRVRKPGLRGILVMIAIGAAEAVTMLVFRIFILK